MKINIVEIAQKKVIINKIKTAINVHLDIIAKPVLFPKDVQHVISITIFIIMEGVVYVLKMVYINCLRSATLVISSSIAKLALMIKVVLVVYNQIILLMKQLYSVKNVNLDFTLMEFIVENVINQLIAILAIMRKHV